MMNRRMRSTAWRVAWAALAVSSLAASAARAQDQAPPPAPVTVAPVVQGNVAATVAATGTVVSRNDARLAAEVAGRLDWVAEPGAGSPRARRSRAWMRVRSNCSFAKTTRRSRGSRPMRTCSTPSSRA